ncbi:hypothetical protein TNCV_1993711 [Trichonephila clavipes]|nr:hypothetical protein TNCV_1993711 [Trichonephila clavipes]
MVQTLRVDAGHCNNHLLYKNVWAQVTRSRTWQDDNPGPRGITSVVDSACLVMRKHYKMMLAGLKMISGTHRTSYEAHFWLNGYVNKQNCRIWSEANPQVYVETPLHPEKLKIVWCALWAGGILLQKRSKATTLQSMVICYRADRWVITAPWGMGAPQFEKHCRTLNNLPGPALKFIKRMVWGKPWEMRDTDRALRPLISADPQLPSY